jgi:hypothetical protein
MVPMITVGARLSVLTEAGTSVASVGDGPVDPVAQYSPVSRTSPMTSVSDCAHPADVTAGTHRHAI